MSLNSKLTFESQETKLLFNFSKDEKTLGEKSCSFFDFTKNFHNVKKFPKG